MLIERSKTPTNYTLPVKVKTKQGLISKLYYYDTEFLLWKAYRQLKKINGSIIPLYPVIYD